MINFYDKTSILAELWLDYRDDPNFTDIFDYCDISLPLSWAFARYIVNPDEPTEQAVALIDEAWDILITALDVDKSIIDQIEISSLDDLMRFSEQ
jgi:hypothetical protein